MAHGRLIFPHQAVFAIHDTNQTETAPPPGFTSGFDREFDEPVVHDGDGDGVGAIHRVEREVTVDAQIQSETLSSLAQLVGGAASSGQLELTLWYEELVAKGLIEPNGWPALKNGARLDRLEHGGVVTMRFENEKQLYITEARPESFMLSPHPNLIAIVVETREQGE